MVGPKFFASPVIPFSSILQTYKSNPPKPPGLFEEKNNFFDIRIFNAAIFCFSISKVFHFGDKF